MQAKTSQLSQTMATNLTADSITWGNSINEGTGRYPSVAINSNGVVVEVHERLNREVWYRVGMVDTDSKTINWGSSYKYDSGVQPHVAIDDGLNVVENHISQNHETLWCHVGKVDADRKTIIWGSSHKYDSGMSPSIAIYSNPPCAIEVHKSQSHDTLSYRHGKVDTNSKTIYWGPSFKYDTGKILKLQLMLVDQRLLKITNLESMIVYGAMLEPLMAQLSTGNQASSMIRESLLELQSVAVDWWSLKIINLKTMKHYGVMLERLMLTGKLSLGEVAISMIQERRLQMQSMTI